MNTLIGDSFSIVFAAETQYDKLRRTIIGHRPGFA